MKDSTAAAAAAAVGDPGPAQAADLDRNVAVRQGADAQLAKLRAQGTHGNEYVLSLCRAHEKQNTQSDRRCWC